MSPEILQRDWLSMRYWLLRCVLPSAVILLIILALLKLTAKTPRALDHMAVIAGFFTLYFILVRGGHIVMMRSLHKDLLKKHEARYGEILAQLNPATMKRRNIGFTLARIKRQLIDEKHAARDQMRR